jgi:hypothetical protein
MIRRRFKSWATAVSKAGLLTESEYQRRRYGRGVRMTDDQLRDVLAEALDDLGPDPTRTQYRDWRERRLSGLNPPPAGLPVDGWLSERLGNGSWQAAKKVGVAWGVRGRADRPSRR